MIDFDDVKKYLPNYLSDCASESLFSELKFFPKNIDQRMYTSFLSTSPIIYQGDGMSCLKHAELPNPEVREINGVVLSNTCDISQENPRMIPSRLVHAPIVKLNNYSAMLKRDFVETNKFSQEAVDQHISSIKKQYISHVFFLPKCSGLPDDSMIFFDRVSSLPSNYISSDKVIEKRIFTLSDFGFYLFLFKLSVHFTRVREKVSRNAPILNASG